jgi:hypothetical protein
MGEEGLHVFKPIQEREFSIAFALHRHIAGALLAALSDVFVPWCTKAAAAKCAPVRRPLLRSVPLQKASGRTRAKGETKGIPVIRGGSRES